MSEVPEINGKPAAKIHVQIEEKVGLANYSNISYGTSVTRYVEDTPETIKAERDAESVVVEKWLTDFFRENVRHLLEDGGKK